MLRLADLILLDQDGRSDSVLRFEEAIDIRLDVVLERLVVAAVRVQVLAQAFDGKSQAGAGLLLERVHLLERRLRHSKHGRVTPEQVVHDHGLDGRDVLNRGRDVVENLAHSLHEMGERRVVLQPAFDYVDLKCEDVLALCGEAVLHGHRVRARRLHLNRLRADVFDEIGELRHGVLQEAPQGLLHEESDHL